MIRPHLFPAPLLLLALLFSLLPGREAVAGVPVRSALLLNMSTGQILYQKSPDTQIPP